MAEWLARRHHLVAVLLLGVFLSPLVWISQYNYPSGDDYPAFYQAHQLGTLAATKWWYLNWTGRYASFFLQSSFPEHATWLTAYTLVPVALLAIGFGCLFAFIKAFFGPALTNREVFTATSCAYVFLISLTPDIATALYWLPTNVQYVGAVFLTLLILAVYVRMESTSRSAFTGIALLVLVLLVACVAGLNEISLLLLMGALAFTCGVQLRTLKRRPTIGVMLLAAGLLFGLVSFLAPGNSVRAAQVHRESQLVKALASAIGLTLYLTFRLVSVTPLLPVSALYLSVLDGQRQKLDLPLARLSRVPWRSLSAFVLCALTVINALLFTASGIHLTERVENVYVYSIVLIWFFVLTVGFANTSPGQLRFSMPRWLTAVVTAFVVLFLVTGFRLQLRRHDFVPGTEQWQKAFTLIKTKSPYTNAYLDILSGRAAAYARHNTETTARVRAADGGCIELTPVSYPPDTLFIHVKYPWTWCPAEYMKTFGEISR